MNILDRYLWKNVLMGIAIAWFALLLLDLFFAFISELDSVSSHASYSTADAMIYLAYTIPRRLYEFFPTSILIGALLGLGGLAGNSEFTAMRAAGISIMQIAYAVLKLGLVMAIIIFSMGEWVVPNTDRYAKNFKANQQNKKITYTSNAGVWMKEKNEIIYIGRIISENHLNDIRIYRLGAKKETLGDISFIDTAKYNGAGWDLQSITTHRFEQKKVITTRNERGFLKELINQKIIDVTATTPELLSAIELSTIIRHQQENGLNTNKYKLAFWKHFTTPLSALVMLILALPFLFGSQRSGSTGQRVFIGLVVGIGFFLINRALNELGSVYEFTPFISAFMPLGIFLIIGLLGIKRIR